MVAFNCYIEASERRVGAGGGGAVLYDIAFVGHC